MNIPTLNSADEVIAALKERGTCWGRVPATETYHAWKPLIEQATGAAVVSKSALHEFAVSPYRYKHGKRKESAAMGFGQLVDCLALTPELFEAEYYLAKETFDKRTKEGKAKASEMEAEAAGRKIIKPDEYEPVKMCADCVTEALADHGLIMGENAAAQVAMFVYMTELYGEPLSCPLVITGCLDILPFSGNTLDDLKTTREDVENEAKLRRVCEDFGYGIQGALYTDLFNLCTGEQRNEFRFLFVSTMTVGDDKPAAQSRMVSMSNYVLDDYRKLYVRLLRAFALASATGEWGSKHLPTVIFEPSKWEMEKIYNS